MHTELIDAIQHNNVVPIETLKPYLWRDEINDLFILTKHMELYLYLGYKTETIDKAVLGCYSWSGKIAFQLRRKENIRAFWGTDYGLYTFKTLIGNLPFILSAGSFRKRPDIKGEWIQDKERKLGHKIYQYQYCKNDYVFSNNEAGKQAERLLREEYKLVKR